MHMVSASTRWTAEMVRALPEDRNRYEVIEGELFVNPGPSWDHQTAVERLLARLMFYLDGNHVGHVKCSPADIEFNGDTLVQPDLFVVPRGPGKAPRKWEDVKELLLVVEVLSPISSRADRVRKRHLYLGQGAREYWIVDLDARLIEVWRLGQPQPTIVSDMLEWHPEKAAEPFVLNLPVYFEQILDE